MRILAFDTSYGACSAAVAAGGSVIASLSEPMERGHAERLVPMIAEVMKAAGIDLAGLDLLAVTVGPGTFTGVRVAVAAAEGLALATGLPVAGATSLAVMAAGLGVDWRGHTIAVAVDARRGECHVQIFDGDALKPVGEPRLMTPEAAARLLSEERRAVVIGTAAEAVVAAARAIGRDAEKGPDVAFPVAADLVLIAPCLPRLDRVRPLYLRAPDAKPQGEAHGGEVR